MTENRIRTCPLGRFRHQAGPAQPPLQKVGEGEPLNKSTTNRDLKSRPAIRLPRQPQGPPSSNSQNVGSDTQIGDLFDGLRNGTATGTLSMGSASRFLAG